MNKNSCLNLVFFIFTFCQLSVLTGCKESQQRSVLLELAAETHENYNLAEEEQTLARNGNDFSIKFFRKIVEEEGEKNVFVSTIGMFYSLNIINNGASGQTRQEICDALDIDTADMESVNKFCRRLMIGQAKEIEDEFFGSSYMRTATLFQAGNRVNIAPSFQEILQHDYFANIINGDIDGAQQQMIDKWCAEQTEGLLSSFPVKETDGGSANLFVANFFNGRWVQKFDKESTKKEPFKGGISPMVNMMNKTENEEVFSYAKLDDFSMLMIPYAAGYRLYVILPDKIDGLASLLQSLDGEKLRTAMSQLKSYNHTYVKIPKFEIDYSFNANNCLASLGVGRMFSDHAELNRIQSEPMKVGEIVQKTKVILDEEGTRAGALTSGSFITLSSMMNPTEAYFYADHPFAYIIQDPFDNYCFMGTFWGDSQVD